MSKHLTPTEIVERLIGRPEVLAAVTGQNGKAAYGWRHGSSSRDAGDIPSTRLMRALLKHALSHDIPLTAEHLIWGASEAEIDALIRTRFQVVAE